MQRLDVIVIIIGFVFILFFIDLFQRRKFNFLHFMVFAGGTGVIIFFILFPKALETFGKYFGLARGADLIVYMSIIFLTYLYIELVNTDTKKDLQITKLCTAFSVTNPIKQKKSLIDQHKPIGFLIRAYNEESTIGSVIEEIVQGGYTFIVVCDDGSTDSTNNIVRNLQKKNKHEADIVLLSHLINRGGGAANKTLFAYAQSNSHENGIQRRVTYDADGQMNIADMKTFERAIDGDCSLEVIIGSRFIEGGSAKNIPFVRKCILQGARVITYIFNGIWLTDVSTGYRMYRSDILEKIHIESDGFTYQNDIVHSMYREGLVYTEIPVHISYTEYSLAKGQSSSNALKILKELFWKSWFYK